MEKYGVDPNIEKTRLDTRGERIEKIKTIGLSYIFHLISYNMKNENRLPIAGYLELNVL